MEDEEAIRIGEIYGSIRKYGGLIAGFRPNITNLSEKEIKELQESLKLYFETVPKHIRDRFTLNSSYASVLERECERRLRDFNFP